MCANGPACAAHAKGFNPVLSSFWRKSNPGQCDSYQNGDMLIPVVSLLGSSRLTKKYVRKHKRILG